MVVILPSDPLRRRRVERVGTADDHPSIVMAWKDMTLFGVSRNDDNTELLPIRLDPALMIGTAPITTTGAQFDGIAMRAMPGGTFLSVAETGEVFEHRTTWERIHTDGAPALQETAFTMFADGALFLLFTDASVTPRPIHALRLDPSGASWTSAFSLRGTGLIGPDPSVDTAADRAVLAYVDESSGERVATIASLTRDGAVVVGPCTLPSTLSHANDPSIACGAGWCAIAWIEGSDSLATDFVTRVIQVPAEPALVCP